MLGVGDKLGTLLSSIVKDDKSLYSFLVEQTEGAPAGININGRELLLNFFLLVTTTTCDITFSVNGTLGVLTTSKFCTLRHHIIKFLNITIAILLDGILLSSLFLGKTLWCYWMGLVFQTKL